MKSDSDVASEKKVFHLNFCLHKVYELMKRFTHHPIKKNKTIVSMKKFSLSILFFLTTLTTLSAQPAGSDDKPQPIVSITKEEHEPAWYARQAQLWKAETERDPTSETAWWNYYQATRYQLKFTDGEEDFSPLAHIQHEVEKALPGSFPYYLIKNMNSRFVAPDPEALDDMMKAIRMRPDAVSFYNDYVVCLMTKGDEQLLEDILKRWYDSGTYSASLLNYAYNALSGLEENALLFVNGDSPTYSSLMVQYGKNLFRQTKIICTSLLFDKRYCQVVCHELGVEPVPLPTDAHSQADYDHWLEELELRLIHETGRPAYFSAMMELPSFQDKLYSEGLVFRYSEKRYDNLAVKQRNYEHRYLTDYLYETFVPESYEASTYKHNLNYIPTLKSLLIWYKDHDRARYKELYGKMMTIVRRTPDLTPEKRQAYYDEINR